jgi:hypothetical protein
LIIFCAVSDELQWCFEVVQERVDICTHVKLFSNTVGEDNGGIDYAKII